METLTTLSPNGSSASAIFQFTNCINELRQFKSYMSSFWHDFQVHFKDQSNSEKVSVESNDEQIDDLYRIKSTRKDYFISPMDIVCKIKSALNDQGKSMTDSSILMLGSTTKENSVDIHKSKSAETAQILIFHSSRTDVVDPIANRNDFLMQYHIQLCEEIKDPYDVIVYAVQHKEFGYINWEYINRISSQELVVLDFKNTLGSPKYYNSKIKYLTL